MTQPAMTWSSPHTVSDSLLLVAMLEANLASKPAAERKRILDWLVSWNDELTEAGK